MPKYSEKRKHTRIPLAMKVALCLSGRETFIGKSINISFGGMKIALPNCPQVMPDDTCEVTLFLEEEGTIIKFICRVIYNNKTGVGVKFISIDIDYYNHFKNLMVVNNSNPNKLLKELEHHPGILKDFD